MSRPRILVVEDELIVAEDLKMTLDTLGYEVIGISPTGEHAIELAGEGHPDLILMDIMLAGELDGITTAERIHATQDIPVIFVTAYADEKLVNRAKVTEPYGYIVKPFNEREVHSNIEISLYRHRIEREIRKRDAILLGIGSGIEWFLRAFAMQASRGEGARTPHHGKPAYFPLLESIGDAMGLFRIAVFRYDDPSSPGKTLSLDGEWSRMDSVALRQTPLATHLRPGLLGIGAQEEDLKMGKGICLDATKFDPAVSDLSRSYRFNSLVAFELQVRERPFGLIFFVNDTARSWPADELEAMRIATNIIGAAIGLPGTPG